MNAHQSGDALSELFERHECAFASALALSREERILPEEFAHRDGLKKRLELSARSIDLRRGGETFAEARLVHIFGDRTEIFSAMIYPTDPSRIPVFGAEVIVVAGILRLVFIDLQTPGLDRNRQTSLGSLMASIRARHPWAAAGDPPPWVVEDSSGSPLYHRAGAQVESQPSFGDAYGEVLEAWLNLEAPAGAGNSLGVEEPLRRYKDAHIEHSPGTVFLERVFGEDWTRRFHREFLYR